MQRVVPALRISDIERSLAFYRDALGFRVEREHRFGPDFPVFMEIHRDGMILFLTQHAGDCNFGGLVHLYVPDVDAWHLEALAAGLAAEPPSDDIPGVRILTLVDPDGNQVRVCSHPDP